MARLAYGGLIVVLACGVVMEASAQTQSTPSDAERNTLSDVVVESIRPGVARRIDRTSYDIKDDPQAKAASLIDILGKLPSVSVGADGKVRLLGAGNVSVQFDGKTTQGSDIKLNSLTGADVERIEVITNPSSQFSAQGAGGIINIITRKQTRPGWSGQASITGGNEGVDARLTPSLTFGKWTLSATLGASRRGYIALNSRDRTYLDGSGASLGTQQGRSRDDQDNETRQGEVKLIYRLTDKQTLTARFSAFDFDSYSDQRKDVRSSFAGAPPYTEIRDGDSRMRDRNLDITYERRGAREGESLKLDAGYERWRWGGASDFVNEGLGETRRYQTRNLSVNKDLDFKLDYERPFGGKMLLTAGGSWTRGDVDAEQGLDNISGPPTLGASYDRRLTSRRDTAAAYASFQFPVMGWTVLPGARLEDTSLDLKTIGGVVDKHETNLFPSLHVSRDVAKGLNLKFSYSRRIQRQSPDILDPAIRYGNSESAWSGNPNLKPTFTDAYEIKLVRTGKRASLDLTLYDREARGEVAWLNRLSPEGVSISMPVNASRIARRGGEASLRGPRGPLGDRFKYVATANLFQMEGEQLLFGVTRDLREFSYAGTLQLDYKSPAPAGGQAQQVQLSARLFGPQDNLQDHMSSFYRVDFTWRRPIAKKVSGVLTVTDLFSTQKLRGRTWSDGYLDLSEARSNAPRIRLSLTYEIGGKP